MGLIDKAKEAKDGAAQRAAELKGHATTLASDAAEKASALGEQTQNIAGGLRDRASEIGTGLAEAAIERTKTAMSELNAALPVMKLAGYTLSDVSVELGIPPKIVAGFAIAGIVSDEQIEKVLHDHADAKLATAMVNALVRAHKLQLAIKIGGLQPKGITLEIGLTPTVAVKFG